jgi:hypothetical protein
MNHERRPIDDPEVRQQHRRQLRADLLRVARRAFTLAAVVFAIFTAIKVLEQLGARVPATVVAIDAAESAVTVTSADPAASGTYTVRDTDAYRVGDEVRVVSTGEDQEPTFLDREPLLRPIIVVAGLLAALAIVGMLPRQALVWWHARRRRRALIQPWRHTQFQLEAASPRATLLSDPAGTTSWRLRDVPDDLPHEATLEALVAGTPQRLAVRFFGSTQLATASRTG